MMTTITLLQLMGIIPTMRTCRKCNDSLGGKVQVKHKLPYVPELFSHSASKTYIRQNTVLKSLYLNFERVVLLVSVKEKPPTDTYKMRVL